MSGFRESESYQVIWLVRRLFRALARRAEANLADLGISVADRAVLEFLYPDHRLSVPEIAARYEVSRQHVQVTVNALLERGLVVARDNPRHRRSPLLELSDSGRSLFAGVLERDAAAVNELFAAIPQSRVRTTRQTLRALLDQLGKGEST